MLSQPAYLHKPCKNGKTMFLMLFPADIEKTDVLTGIKFVE
jgi:hypothetical protein